MKKNLIFYLGPAVFFIVGMGMLIAGYNAEPGSLTDDGYPLNYFFYFMGGSFILLPIVSMIIITFFFTRKANKINDLKTTGIKGKARVLGMQRTGMSLNNIPQVILQLRITTDIGEQFPASYKECIDPLYYNLITPEKDLIVYVNRDNKKEVYLDLEAEWARLAER
ncbi:hypothetical protein HNP38_000679 [Chryseobacterium defluvii]|uniref:Uncharacterized protein n=1 Tax=Chryseobacterium defluvii TaxID=160396 RepID=A0A840KBM7_9FLAO|nr:hypothetical protein [Chryseobacterium defluvii]MBB4805407.1 hypothetical protein [Chryseobacterium defluvii]